MATRTGVGGQVTIPVAIGPPANLRVREWRYSQTTDPLPDDELDGVESNAKVYVGGMCDATGTVIASADRADHPTLNATMMKMQSEHQQPTAGFILLEGHLTDGTTDVGLKFAALVTSFNITIIKADRVTYEIGFQRSGDTEITPFAT